ncbi:FAD binding domain-containing protein [Nonomuraea maheshkhaliensis]|uniref:FAD binding domain-containing protein n=1 Tax=Nonomuraea maheshkhaliensis TaxID=419590 RepID=A0ABP4QKV8_9ACTN
MANQPDIAIVGGSITGPTAALRLHQEGFTNVHIYEASPEPMAQVGGAITLEHPALGVLDTIGVPQAEIVPFPSERIVSIKIADRSESRRFETLYPGRHTAWHLINKSLITRLPPGMLQTGKRVVGLDIGADERPRLHFRDGETASADLVVFADGRRSIGRSILEPKRSLEYSGIVAWRGQSAWAPKDLQDYTRYEPETTRLAVFPMVLSNGDLGSDWALYMPMSESRFTEVCGVSPTQRSFILPHQVSDKAKQLVVDEAHRMLTPDAIRMVEATISWSAAPLLTTQPPRQMAFPIGRGHAVLVGDALAPVSPLTGRGANNGVEQINDLTATLVQCTRYGSDITAALQGWERRMLPTVRFSLEVGPKLAQRLGLQASARASAAHLRSSTTTEPPRHRPENLNTDQRTTSPAPMNTKRPQPRVR